jgi:hypothetical protein
VQQNFVGYLRLSGLRVLGVKIDEARIGKAEKQGEGCVDFGDC